MRYIVLVLLYTVINIIDSKSVRVSKLRPLLLLLRTPRPPPPPPLLALPGPGRPDIEPFLKRLPAQARKAYPWLRSNAPFLKKIFGNPTRHFLIMVMVGFLNANARQ